MSGGSYDYLYSKIEDMARGIPPYSMLRKAFKTHLLKVAQACHDIEWNDSGDGADGEDAAIKACLGAGSEYLVLSEAIKEAQQVMSDLTSAYLEAKKVCKP